MAQVSTLYKLTTRDGWTRKGASNACLWGEGVSHFGTGKGQLCGPGYIHAYTHPLLAVLLNPIHAALSNPILWEAQGVVALRDHDLKVGCVSLTTVRQLPLPVMTNEQRIRCAIHCAQVVEHDDAWRTWAQEWLAGQHRTLDEHKAYLNTFDNDDGPDEAAWNAFLSTCPFIDDDFVGAHSARAACHASILSDIDLASIAQTTVKPTNAGSDFV